MLTLAINQASHGRPLWGKLACGRQRPGGDLEVGDQGNDVCLCGDGMRFETYVQALAHN